MRQRIQPRGPARGSSYGTQRPSAMGVDEEPTATRMHSIDSENLHQPIPMYNPLSYMRPGAESSSSTQSNSWRSEHDGSEKAAYKSPKRPSHLFKKIDRYDSMTHAQTFVPDAKYKEFLRSGHSVIQKTETSFAIRPVCCAKFCAVFSWVAVLFLLFVGIIYDRQPLFIPGALPMDRQTVDQDSGAKEQVFYATNPTERLLPASNAYRAALAYLITCSLCFAYSRNMHFWVTSKLRNYQDIPDGAPDYRRGEVPMSRLGRSPLRNKDLPTVHPNATWQRAYSKYDNDAGVRMVETLRSIYNRVRIFVASKWVSYKDHNRVRRREAGPKEV